ncbi:phage protein Gp37/Gp68 [Leptospira interrogans serovar Zanoni str. LT2156]|uniref:Phage protein Gp37/Gp68 n=1 Tax=Leptospira interrogans serovar Zanoni str. LT2156 TaxID=1001601 RepID=M6HG06_LEPIR|nr:phage protein Gp37/Gp68 [Leptospira interrogans serovar Zanoni str. LT2156]
MKNSKIEWTDHTWNPVTGCTKVSAGCRNCYAEKLSKRKFGEWKDRDFSEILLKEHKLKEPFSIRKPSKIFVNSMSDLFHKDVPDSFIDKVFGVMALNPKHTFQVLTKRPDRMLKYLTTENRASEVGEAAHSYVEVNWHNRNVKMPYEWRTDQWDGSVEWPLPNVWIGVSIEDQKTADERIPDLVRIPASIRFLSCEPLLGNIDLELGNYDIRWVIVGGESGSNARPIHPSYVETIRDQCVGADVPFFFKQWGEWYPYQDEITYDKQAYNFGDEFLKKFYYKLGKKKSGARLDGEEWKQFPKKAADFLTQDEVDALLGPL